VLPGLIDMHTHLTFELSSLSYEGLKISTAREALHGARNAKRTLEAGFTTVRNVGAKDYADIALRDAINDGDVIGRASSHPGRLWELPAGTVMRTCCRRLFTFKEKE